MSVRCSVEAEMDRQDWKWGQQDHADLYWLAILTEELGEVARALVEDDGDGDLTGEEITQCAAVAMQWLESRRRREHNGKR